MFRLAVRNLIQNKARFLVSVGGIAIALTLVLIFSAIVDGATGRLTAYIDHAGADIWVSQEGVQTMHMSSSALPAAVPAEVGAVPGVEAVTPILYASSPIQAGGKEYLAYVFGIPEGAAMGTPSKIVAGASVPGPGEVIIDHAIADPAGLEVGDEVSILGQPLRIAGLTSETSSIVSSVAVVRMEDFVRARGGGEGISFVLVKVAPGESSSAVGERISASVSDVTVQTRQEFAHEERELAKDMMADILNIINAAGFLTGLAVVALTVYIATVARRKEYGVLKAVGTRNRPLYSLVLIQALLSVATGLVASIALTFLLSAFIPRLNESLVLTVTSSSLLRVSLVSIVIAGLAALLPAGQLGRLEPATVVRRGGS